MGVLKLKLPEVWDEDGLIFLLSLILSVVPIGIVDCVCLYGLLPRDVYRIFGEAYIKLFKILDKISRFLSVFGKLS